MTFLATSAKKVKEATTLIEIALTQPSALTLYLSDRPYNDGSNFYQPVLLDVGTIRSKNAGGVGAVSTFTFSVAHRRIYQQANATDVFGDLLDDYRFLGAAVTLRVVYTNTSGTSYSDALFSGIISEVHDMTIESITFEVDESASANVRLPRYTIEGDTFANAPQESIGAKVPLILGSFLSDATVAANSDTLKATIASLGFAAPISQCVMYNNKAGTSPFFWTRHAITEFIHADHDLDNIVDQAVFQYFPEVPALCTHVSDADALVTSKTSNELGAHYLALHPRRRLVCNYLLTDATGTGAVESSAITDLENLFDRNPDNYATIDNGEKIYLALPSLPALGAIFQGTAPSYTDAGISLCILIGTGGTGNVKTYMTWDGPNEKWGTHSTFAANPANPTVGRHTLTWSGGWDGTSWEDWQFWESSAEQAWFVIYKEDDTSARIHAAWLEVVFYPNIEAKRDKMSALETKALSMIRRGTGVDLSERAFIYGGLIPDAPKFHLNPSVWRGRLKGYAHKLAAWAQAPAAYNDSIYFGGASYEDDGSGTYTGSANALIENPADMIRFLCLEACGLSSGLINSTASTLGSFPDARADLNLLTDAVVGSATYKLSAIANSETTREGVMDDILSHCPARCYRDRDGVLKMVVHNSNPATNQAERLYGTAISWKDHIEKTTFKCGLTSREAIVNEVYVNYRKNAADGSFARTSFVTATASDNGTGTTDGTRETACSDSQTAHGVTNRIDLDADWIHDATTATALRNYYLDRFKNPKTLIELTAIGLPADIEQGHIVTVSTDVDAFVPCPKFGGLGTWSGVYFEILELDLKITSKGNVYRMKLMEV